MNTETNIKISKGRGWSPITPCLGRLLPGPGDGEGASGPGHNPHGAGRSRRGRVSDLQGRGVLDGEPQKTVVRCVLSLELSETATCGAGLVWCWHHATAAMFS